MQSTSYYGREYVREVFNESTKSKCMYTIYTMSVLFPKRTRNILSLLNSQFFKVDLKSPFCTICMQCIIHNAGSVLALKNLHQRVFATMWQKNDGYYYRYVTKVETCLQLNMDHSLLPLFLIEACMICKSTLFISHLC